MTTPPAGVRVHPKGLCESDTVGEGTRVWAFAHVMAGAKIGRNCNIGDHAFVESGVVLGDNVTVKNGVAIWEGVTADDDVFIGPNAVFTNDLMPRAAKRNGSLLLIAALSQLVMHYLDLYWCVMPNLHPEGVRFGITDVATFCAVGGIFLAAIGWVSSRRALVPLRDPRLPESLSFENV